jgi:conjugative transfer region protein TrbK
MDSKMLARTIIVATLAGLLVTTIALLHRDGGQGQSDGALPSSLLSDDLSAELKRCGKLGPQDAAEDAHCQAVWEENRRRFFGYTPHSVPGGPEASAPASNLSPSTGSPRGSTPSSYSAGAPQP